MEFKHKSVLLFETIDNLNIKPDGIYVDGTLGGGGHSFQILKRLGDGGRLIGIDQDEDALKAAGERLAIFEEKVTTVRSNYCHMKQVLHDLGIEKVSGIVLDLGVSSYQLDTAERGFSYMANAPLDMRMDNRAARSAYTVLNEYSADELKKIIYDFGEERFAPKIVAGIIKAREKAPIETTGELVEIIKNSIPSFARREELSSVKRVFQAVRIEVNKELDIIAPTIEAAVSKMNEGGRIVIITFHSLEDRIVKQTFNQLASGCTCPKDFPVCVCGNKPKIKILTKKPILPSESELAVNSRSKSAKLRVAEKI
jgi:16S rRNA (cytosine1402-N4)-methyltransferase